MSKPSRPKRIVIHVTADPRLISAVEAYRSGYPGLSRASAFTLLVAKGLMFEGAGQLLLESNIQIPVATP